jgi:hypothetical protein
MMKRISFLVALAAGGAAFAQTAHFVAGIDPAVRPAGAPVIAKFEQTPAWKAQALKGIAPPQTGLRFLDDQGAWYTPFDRPNQKGPYDIRGLYPDAARKD